MRIADEIFDMFTQSSIIIPDARENSITEVLIYKTGIKPDAVNDKNLYPSNFMMNQNYPNPFNPSTQITFSVPNVTDVILKVYDILGQEITVLVNERKQPGEYNVTWDAKGMPSGVYFYRIVAGEFVETKKMVLLR